MPSIRITRSKANAKAKANASMVEEEKPAEGVKATPTSSQNQETLNTLDQLLSVENEQNQEQNVLEIWYLLRNHPEILAQLKDDKVINILTLFNLKPRRGTSSATLRRHLEHAVGLRHHYFCRMIQTFVLLLAPTQLSMFACSCRNTRRHSKMLLLPRPSKTCWLVQEKCCFLYTLACMDIFRV